MLYLVNYSYLRIMLYFLVLQNITSTIVYYLLTTSLVRKHSLTRLVYQLLYLCNQIGLDISQRGEYSLFRIVGLCLIYRNTVLLALISIRALSLIARLLIKNLIGSINRLPLMRSLSQIAKEGLITLTSTSRQETIPRVIYFLNYLSKYLY